ADHGVPDGQLSTVSAPAVTDTDFLALNFGTLSSIRLASRTIRWTFTGDGGLITAPVVVNGTVFIGSSTGKVYGIDAATGGPVWIGTSPQAIIEDSEDGGPTPPAGPAAGENLLIFHGENSLLAWKFH